MLTTTLRIEGKQPMSVRFSELKGFIHPDEVM
jgi:hypothetical protein